MLCALMREAQRDTTRGKSCALGLPQKDNEREDHEENDDEEAKHARTEQCIFESVFVLKVDKAVHALRKEFTVAYHATVLR